MTTEIQVLELMQKMHAMRGELIATALAMSEEEAEVRRPELDGEAGWSAKDVLSHLRNMDVGYRRIVLPSLGEASNISAQVRAASQAPEAGEERNLETPHDHSILELVRELERTRSVTMEFIADLTLEQFDMTASNQLFGELTVLQWLRSYYRHDRQHIAQIKGEKSDYAPRFLSGQEPDQRTSG